MSSMLTEVTSVGRELMSMGKITSKQLEEATVKYHKAINNGHPDAQFGEILVECGFVTLEDVRVAIQNQSACRDIKPTNHQDTQDSLKALRAMVSSYEKTTTKKMKAFAVAK